MHAPELGTCATEFGTHAIGFVTSTSYSCLQFCRPVSCIDGHSLHSKPAPYPVEVARGRLRTGILFEVKTVWFEMPLGPHWLSQHDIGLCL